MNGPKDKTTDEIKHDIEAMQGSMESCDSDSPTSYQIASLQKELFNRGVSQVGRNDCFGASVKGRQGRDDL